MNEEYQNAAHLKADCAYAPTGELPIDRTPLTAEAIETAAPGSTLNLEGGVLGMDRTLETPEGVTLIGAGKSGEPLLKAEDFDPYLREITAETIPTKHFPDPQSIAVTHNSTTGKTTATYDGDTLEQRAGDVWFDPATMQVNGPRLQTLWKTKFQKNLPKEFGVSLSFEGPISFGGKRGLFDLPPARNKRVSKHSGNKSKKKARK